MSLGLLTAHELNRARQPVMIEKVLIQEGRCGQSGHVRTDGWVRCTLFLAKVLKLQLRNILQTQVACTTVFLQEMSHFSLTDGPPNPRN